MQNVQSVADQLGVRRPGDKSVSDDLRLPQAIRDLDLGPIKFKLKNDASLNWSEDEINTAENEYRKFLALSLDNPLNEPNVPCGHVDKFWHQHMLDSAKYCEETQAIFGHYLHHFPYFGMLSEEDERAMFAAGTRTLARYREKFGEPPYVWTAPEHCFDNCRKGCSTN